MVSFWPWKHGSDDTASFERTLSNLSEKIKKANVKQDSLRSSGRRYKALWTLYTSLAYLVSALILVLVPGWQNWGPVEYTAVAGGPVLIYLVRYGLNAFYDYRLSKNQAYLDDLSRQKEEAIENFKKATHYNSTQQLLEKYGAAPKQPPASKDAPSSGTKRKAAGNDSAKKSTPQRTGIPPPATANIRRPPSMGSPQSFTPPQPHEAQPYMVGQHTPLRGQRPSDSPQNNPLPAGSDDSASFAPNAFTTSPSSPTVPQYSDASGRQWYDRIFDVLLGEDETRASNRLALICQHCRLVNGQAPPGAKKMEDVGRWRCKECRGWNGVENEVEQILEVTKRKDSTTSERESDVPRAYETEATRHDEPVEGEPGPTVDQVGEHVEEHDAPSAGKDAGEGPPARSTRSRRKQISEEDS